MPRKAQVEGTPLALLTSHQCRYALNDVPRGGNYLFCGEPVRDAKSSWCAHHHAMVYVPGTGRRGGRLPIGIPVDLVGSKAQEEAEKQTAIMLSAPNVNAA